MKNKFVVIMLAAILGFCGHYAMADKAVSPVAMKAPAKAAPAAVEVNTANYTEVCPLTVVNNASAYVGKNIKMKAVFDKFSTLGLDYKPAMRSSQDYISFLIKRDDVKDHTVPLSEMKIFIKRKAAEKFIDLDSGDIVEIYGKVFSSALTDPWVEVDKLVVIEKKNKTEKK